MAIPTSNSGNYVNLASAVTATSARAQPEQEIRPASNQEPHNRRIFYRSISSTSTTRTHSSDSADTGGSLTRRNSTVFNFNSNSSLKHLFNKKQEPNQEPNIETINKFLNKIKKPVPTVEDIRNNPHILNLFKQHVAAEFSSESLNFIESAKSARGNIRLNRPEYLLNTYISTEGNQQINISYGVKESFESALEAFQGKKSRKNRDDLKGEIERIVKIMEALIEQDTMPRFLRKLQQITNPTKE